MLVASLISSFNPIAWTILTVQHFSGSPRSHNVGVNLGDSWYRVLFYSWHSLDLLGRMWFIEMGHWVTVRPISVRKKCLHHLTNIVIFTFVQFRLLRCFLLVRLFLERFALIELERLAIGLILLGERAVRILGRLVILWSLWWRWGLLAHFLGRH